MDPEAERGMETGQTDRVSSPEAVRLRAQTAAPPTWKTALRPLFALSFYGACLGALALLLMFHAPAVNVPIFYFTTRPSFVWFGMLLPFVVLGALGVRRRWFVLGCIFWAASLLACDDSLAWVRPFHDRARMKFEASQMAYLSFTKAHGDDVAVLDVPLRIVSWNVDAGRLGATLAVAQLADLRPDIALIEELEWGEHSAMIDALGASAYFRDYYIAHPTTSNSIGILSRFPITEGNSELLRWNSGVWQVHFAPDRRITCLVFHLSAPDLKMQLLRGWTWQGLHKLLGERREEFETVREMVGLQTDGSPVLMTGDFNVPSNYPDLSIATAGMKDAFSDKGFGWGKTAPANFRVVRPDMIFVPSDATVFDAFAVPTRNSDHCPMVAEISIPVPRLKPVELPLKNENIGPAPKLIPAK
jgi:endonuclease/exonuclease/phosphatase (EEP) superfamily protein YafD